MAMTDHVDSLNALRSALDDERSTGLLREQFIAVLAHDLRNPLSSIAACSQLLRMQTADPEAVVKIAGRIEANVDRIARLIADLFDFARGQLGGGLSLRREAIDDLPRLIDRLLDELRVAWPDRKLEVRVEVGEAVTADRGRLEQLISNLVTNALVYGSKDTSIAIQVSTQGGLLVIDVHNEGVPIHPDTLPGIFDAFTRQPSSSAVHPDGLGLGLFICERIASAHGGRLEVTSTQDGGTRFKASLPQSLNAP